jgi:hypothetical protein
MIDAIFVQCLKQRQQVLDRHPSLNVMNRIEDKASPGTKNLDALADLLANLFGCAEWESVLRVHAPTPKGDPVTEARLEL